jgi:abortive infection bacteriophage resistance protein
MDFDELDVSKIYTVLCCVQYLLNTINVNSDFKRNIIQLIDSNQFIDLASLGFTTHWREESIWSLQSSPISDKELSAGQLNPFS